MKIGCPACAYDCPYCDEEGQCGLSTRATDCDDYVYYMGEDEEED